MKKFRVLMTGGGTAGHVYPILAVISELQTLSATRGINTEIRYMGAYGSFKEKIEENAVRVQRIAGSRLRRYFSVRNLIDVPKLFWGILQALAKVYLYMPDVVFSRGGPGSFPVVLASRFYRIPIIVHESDATPSLNTRLASRFANTIAVSFASTTNSFPGKEVVYTGNPIREYLLTEQISPERAKGFFGFDPNRPLVLVLGGSQGANKINDFILDALPVLLGNVQIFHQTGPTNHERVVAEAAVMLRDQPEDIKDGYKAIGYFEKDLRIALQAADLVVSRAGASAMFEIAAFGKPSIMIPLPPSVTPHQGVNAIEYEKAGATMIMEQENLLPNLFLENVKNILSDKKKYVAMAGAASAFYKPGAASNLADIILRYS